ncbi:uncharacterized protein LOC130450460 [Diorhabda sublineata]|uniref:uncharacterized protein LOC130450460 n=1 Tax=Diorhabda sublineata TaxID=1163346 RepID=UPI0024E132A1|nr:uncharacterized protein LOC130450460 [Diorhabda sublineata]
MILAGDFNAKHTSWGGDINDERGQDIVDWTTRHNIYIHNTYDSLPTFQTTRGKSWIDLTMTKTIIIHDWTVQEEDTLSDHHYVCFSLQIQKGQIQQRTQTRNDINNINTEELKIIHNTTKTHNKTKKTNQIWWTPELQRLRQATNHLRKKYQQERDTINRRHAEHEYLRQRRLYKNTIKETKNTTIRQYFTNTDPDGPWNTAYRIIRNKNKSNNKLSTIKKDGTWTIDRNETIQYLHHKYFPNDNEEEDEEEHKHIRQKKSKIIYERRDNHNHKRHKKQKSDSNRRDQQRNN